MCARTWCCACCARARSAGSRCSTAWWRSSSPSAWCGTAGRWSSTALLLDQRSSSDLQFPIWIYYLALPVGGALMLVRYIIRLVRYAFFFDPATMTVGPRDRARGAARACAAVDRRISDRGPCGPSAFLLLFFGLLAAGHADLPGARHVRGGALFRVRPADDRPGAEHDRPAQLDDVDGAAAVRHGRGVHAARRRGAGAGRSVAPPGSAASRARSAWSRWCRARCSRRSPAHRSRPRWRWARSCCRR